MADTLRALAIRPHAASAAPGSANIHRASTSPIASGAPTAANAASMFPSGNQAPGPG